MKQLVLSISFLLITNTLEKSTTSTLYSTEITEFVDYTTSDPVLESTVSYDENIGDLLNIKNISAEENPIDQQVEESTGNLHTTAEINTSHDDHTEYDTGRVAATEDTPEHDKADANELPQDVTISDVTTDAAVTSVSDEIQRDEPVKEIKDSDNLYQTPNTFIMNTGKEEFIAASFTDNVSDVAHKEHITEFTKSSNNKQRTTEDESVFIDSSKPFANRRMMLDVAPLHDYEPLKSFKEIGKRTQVPCTMRSHQKIIRTHLPIYIGPQLPLTAKQTHFKSYGNDVKNVKRTHLPLYIAPFLPLRLIAKPTDLKSGGNGVKSLSLKKNILKESRSPHRSSTSSRQLNKFDGVFLKLAKATDVSTGQLPSSDRNEYNYVGN